MRKSDSPNFHACAMGILDTAYFTIFYSFKVPICLSVGGFVCIFPMFTAEKRRGGGLKRAAQIPRITPAWTNAMGG